VDDVDWPKTTYPMNAPNDTAIITQPLYVMKMSLAAVSDMKFPVA
jgi:hypothetical protein